jgi:hypothetical protein
MDNNTQSETFWIVRKWFQDDNEIQDVDDYEKHWSFASAECALSEEWYNGYDKGLTGKIFEVKATYAWKEVE